MGAKVQLDNYYSMRDLNRDLNGTSWPSYSGENNLPNGQYYYGVLPRPNPDLFPGVDKDLLKQKMLEHETVFKNQVFELHRLYRVQIDLMDENKKKDEFKHRTICETSSSSSPMASQTTPEDPHRRTSFFGGPPVSGPEFIGSSAGGGSHKGKNVQGGCASPRNSEASQSRPTKVRRMIDLELPADEYLDTDEVEQRETTKYQEIASERSTCLRKPNGLADLNEPPEFEETTASASVDFFNRTQSNSHYIDKGNGENWFSSMLKAGGSNQANYFEKEPLLLRPVQAVFENPHQPSRLFPRHHFKEDLWPAKVNDGFNVFDRSHCLSSFSNPQPPSYGTSSNLVNSWDPSHGKRNSYQTQKPISVQTTPIQSSSQSNGLLEAWWQRNADPCNPGYGTKTPVQNGFYHGSSSGDHNKVPSQISKVSLNYVNGSYNDKAASGSCELWKGRNSFDLNSTGDLNLNEALPNELSDESLAPQVEPKQEDQDRVSVLPWLRAKASNNESTSSRNCPDRIEVRNALDHQDSVASTSYNVDDTRGKKKLLLDINVACEDPEEFENVALVEDEKMETERLNGVRAMIDLNSCLTEDEVPSTTSLTNRSTITNDTKGPERFIIDLEAPINLEDDDEEITDCVVDKELAEALARVAAEAIVTISSFVPENCVTVSSIVPENRVENETASSEDDALGWFVDVVCSFPDAVKSCPDDFEEMTLKLTECTVEEYFPDPPIFDFQAVEETGPGSGPITMTGRARRGPARRGRQKRDFQRDILPGLGSLARHEVTEDLQMFGGLMRATGHAWQCGTRTGRNGSRRGRRKAVAAIPPPPPPEIDPTTTAFPSKPKNGEITVLEDRSLTSWGKTTRRPRRQRCPATAPGNTAPVALA